MTLPLGLYRARDAQKAARCAASLHAACFPRGWEESAFLNLLQNPASAIFFACEPEREIGLILLQCVQDEAEILTLGILPDCRREGIGGGLLQFAEKSLFTEGCRRVFLEVSDGNIAARRLYNSLNYKEFNRRPGYYADGCAAICLEKRLTSPSPPVRVDDAAGNHKA